MNDFKMKEANECLMPAKDNSPKRMESYAVRSGWRQCKQAVLRAARTHLYI